MQRIFQFLVYFLLHIYAVLFYREKDNRVRQRPFVRLFVNLICKIWWCTGQILVWVSLQIRKQMSTIACSFFLACSSLFLVFFPWALQTIPIIMTLSRAQNNSWSQPRWLLVLTKFGFGGHFDWSRTRFPNNQLEKNMFCFIFGKYKQLSHRISQQLVVTKSENTGVMVMIFAFVNAKAF